MGWKVTDVMDERERFVLRALEPNACIAALCREFDISRKSGYKWKKRFLELGRSGLRDKSRRPKNSPNEASGGATCSVIRCRNENPTWGPKKIWHHLVKHHEPAPSLRTIARILERAGVVAPSRRRCKKSLPVARVPLSTPTEPNDLWTVDFKGWWRTKDRARCEPLTVRDAYSRFLLACHVVPNLSIETVEPIFDGLFERYGLPRAIRSDNGTPFVSRKSLGGLTKLSARWRALGIHLERTELGKPEQNGGHERMHRDMKAELEARPAGNLELQQRAIDEWKAKFNEVRPHEALGFKTPAELYHRSPRRYTIAHPQIVYPEHFEQRVVASNGSIKLRQRLRFVSEALAGWPVGLEAHQGRLRVWFVDLLLGETDVLFHGPLKPISPEPTKEPMRRTTP